MSNQKASKQIAHELLKAGAYVNARTLQSEYTPLHCACTTGNLEIARLLHLYGARIQAETSKKQTPLELLPDKYRSFKNGTPLLVPRAVF